MLKSKRYSFVYRKTSAPWHDSTNELSLPRCAEGLADELTPAAQILTLHYSYPIVVNHRLHGLWTDFEPDPNDAFAFHSLNAEGAARVDDLVADV